MQITSNRNFHPNFFHAFPWLLKRFNKKETQATEEKIKNDENDEYENDEKKTL